MNQGPSYEFFLLIKEARAVWKIGEEYFWSSRLQIDPRHYQKLTCVAHRNNEEDGWCILDPGISAESAIAMGLVRGPYQVSSSDFKGD